MIRQKYVDEYIELYRSGKIKFNKERELLIEYLEKYVLNRDDLYFDDEMIEKCIRFGEKWYFPLQSFQKFLIAFEVEGRILNVTIRRNSSGRYFVSILVETEVQEMPKTESTCGIDVGLKDFDILSDSTTYKHPKFFLSILIITIKHYDIHSPHLRIFQANSINNFMNKLTMKS